jgi:hypothetical protein
MIDERVNIDKDSLLVFFGTMNSMPMIYALELKKMGYKVLYFVDVPRSNNICRPEYNYPDISYPYPSWIVEVNILSSLLIPLFPRVINYYLNKHVVKFSKKEINKIYYILNGFYISLSPYLPQNSHKICLSHGSDIDVWADTEGAKKLTEGLSNRSMFKFTPKFLTLIIMKYIIGKQYQGLKNSKNIIYFPKGFDLVGDKIIQSLEASGCRHIPRYDISFEPLKNQNRQFKPAAKKMNIFSGVRFLFETFPDGNQNYNKGNDIIIRGLSDYFSLNPNISIHFVERGEDVDSAKKLCKKYGIDSVVIWHKEMHLIELFKLYQNADVCFDQVGTHWIAGIGAYALWLGKPLIANSARAISSGVWPESTPVCNASTREDIVKWLTLLNDEVERKKISIESKEFVEEYMSPISTLNKTFNFNE